MPLDPERLMNALREARSLLVRSTFRLVKSPNAPIAPGTDSEAETAPTPAATVDGASIVQRAEELARRLGPRLVLADERVVNRLH